MIDRALVSRIGEVARSRVLLVVSDFDGTLSPIVADPAAATGDPDAMSALGRLAHLRDTYGAIVSGRSLAALRRLTEAPAGIRLIGTHGAEMGDTGVDPEVAGQVESLVVALEELAGDHPGAMVERKPIGAAFHYRKALDGDGAADRARTIGKAAGARAVGGKMVVEFLLQDVDKGRAVAALRLDLGADAVVFLGDDTTDEDVFGVLGESDLGVKVGPESSLAQWRVADQSAIAGVLEALEMARRSYVAGAPATGR